MVIAMGDKSRGLYTKYRVERVDQSPKHQDCQYFVLDLTHDKYAAIALRAYAEACRVEYPLLAADLDALAGQTPQEEMK